MLHRTCRWSPFNDKHMYVTLPGWSRQGHSVTFPGCRPHPWPGLPTLVPLPGWSRHGCSVTFPGCPPHPEPVCRPLYLCLGGQDMAVPSPFQGAALTLSQSTNPGIVTTGIVTAGIFGLACVALPSCLGINIYNCVCVCLRLEHCEQYLYFPQGFGERAVLLQAPSLGYSTWARTHVGIPRRGDFMVTDGPVCRGSTVPVRSGLHLLTRRARSPSPSPRASSTFQPGQTRLRCTLGPGRLYVSS